tara:strand:+ start:2192 stop:3220 length:1029 start_codon:yes stop_codon:yes gene_type:complete
MHPLLWHRTGSAISSPHERYQDLDKLELSPTIGIFSLLDLEKQPGFRQGIQLSDDLKKTAKVVEAYRIGPDPIHCGLTCNRPHNRGYLISLIDGSHTNVGIDCGQAHFGASDFEGQVKALKEVERSNYQKSQINKLLDDIPNFRKQAHDLWHKAGPVNNALHNFRELYPPSLVEDLRNRSTRRQSSVHVTKRKGEKEKSSVDELAIDSQGQSRQRSESEFVQEYVGELRGLATFTQKPRTCLKLVQEMMEHVEQTSSHSLSPALLAKFAKFHENITKKLSETISLLEQSELFFNEKNFQLFKFMAEGQYLPDLERIEWNFDQNSGRKLSFGQLKRKRQRLAG